MAGSGHKAGRGATPDRRRPSIRGVSFAPDPRRLRGLLAEVEGALGPAEQHLARNVRLLVGEIVSRLLGSELEGEIRLDLEIMVESVRIDIWREVAEPCEFWDLLDEVVFSDLTTAWGRDRRRPCGAWFEIDRSPG